MQIQLSSLTFVDLLTFVTPVGLAVIGYILSGLNKRIDRVETRQDNVDTELKEMNSHLGKIEGLLEGYFARPKEK